MPEAVQNFIEQGKNAASFDDNILTNIINAYYEDMFKYVDNNSETVKIKATYSSIPSQLAMIVINFNIVKLILTLEKEIMNFLWTGF